MPGIHFFTSEALFNELYKKLVTCRMSLRQILRTKILTKSSAVYMHKKCSLTRLLTRCGLFGLFSSSSAIK